MPENSVKRYLTYNFLKLKSFFLSKDVLSFLVFLLLSAAFWFANALNQERELTLNLPVSIRGIPADIQFEDRLPQTVVVKLKDQGVNLWSYIINRPGAVELFSEHSFQEQGILTITGAQLLAAVGQHLLPSTLVQVLSPETTVARYHRLHEKKVAVRLQAFINPAPQFMLNSVVRVIPDSISVYGSATKIQTVQEVLTRNLVVNELKDTLESTVDLVPTDSLRFSTHSVKVVCSAEMFTEKVVNLPVKIINQPDNLMVRSFPAEIRAVFNIAVSRFKHFSPGDIQVVIDYNEIGTIGSAKRRLKIISHQPYITNIRINPEEVEFLLEEK